MRDIIEALGNCGGIVVDRRHRWGYQLRFVNELEYSGKFLIFTNNEETSLHYHSQKKESFILLDGVLQLRTTRRHRRFNDMELGKVYTFNPFEVHQMRSPSGWAVLLEVATRDDDRDTYREMD